MKNQNKLNKIKEALGVKEPIVRIFYPKEFLKKIDTLIEKLNQDKKDNIETTKNNQLEQTKLTNLLIEHLKANKEVIVANLPKQKEIKIPEYPKEIKIKKPDWWKETKLPEYPKEIDIKKPSWYEKFIPDKLIEVIEKLFKQNSKDFADALDRHKELKNALAVRLASRDLETFYNAVASAISGGMRALTAADVVTAVINNWPADYPDAAVLAQLIVIDGRVDQIEGYVDQIEGYVDQIEGYIDGIEGLLTTIDVDTGNIATSVGVMDDWDNAASDGASVSGDTAHNAADAGEPVKIGGKAIDADPSQAEGNQAPTEVAENNRVNAWFNLHGETMISGATEGQLLTELDQAYDDDPTTATSSAYECWRYDRCTFFYEIDSTGTPTDIVFEIEVTADGTNWHKLMDGFLGDLRYEDQGTATEINHAVSFDICAYKIRVKIVATGTTAANYFTVDDCALFFKKG